MYQKGQTKLIKKKKIPKKKNIIKLKKLFKLIITRNFDPIVF